MEKAASKSSTLTKRVSKDSAKSGHWQHVKVARGGGAFSSTKHEPLPSTSATINLGSVAQAVQIVAFDLDPVSSKSNLSSRAAMQLIEGNLTREDIRMVIPDRTLERRVREDQPLTLDEADAIIRLLRVTDAARRLFEDNARADHWLRTPNPALGGAVPIRVARTDVGGRAVEQVLGRLEYGIYSQLRLWRLINPRHAPGLDGEGARRIGGRWNSPGRPIVYTSDAPALAALELFVNLEPDQRTVSSLPPLSIVAIDVADEMIAHPADLPTEYADQQRWGDDWLAAGANLAVAVPSVVIRWEVNVLLNPRHPDMSKVRLVSTDPFNFDPRLVTPA